MFFLFELLVEIVTFILFYSIIAVDHRIYFDVKTQDRIEVPRIPPNYKLYTITIISGQVPKARFSGYGEILDL